MLYILHGEDELTRSEELAKLRQKLGDPIIASLNTTTLSGRDLSLPALVLACSAIPFGAERRLVIVQDFWSRFELPKERKPKERKPKERRPEQRQPEQPQPEERQPEMSAADAALIKGLLEYLPRMPESTRLVFSESRNLEDPKARNPAFDQLPADHKGIYCKAFPAPKPGQLPRWIAQRMAAKSGSIHPQAAQELSQLVGSNLRQLDQELEKLLAYVDYERMVTVTDIRKVVASAHTINIFALVDAMGMRQTQKAVEHLHDLLDAGEHPLGLLSMIERQFRMLLQMKELRQEGAGIDDIRRTLGIPEKQTFIVEKGLRQAQHFSMARLESIYSHLAEVEQAIKTGEISDVLALDLLVVELCASLAPQSAPQSHRTA